jgi:hypothetical protein
MDLDAGPLELNDVITRNKFDKYVSEEKRYAPCRRVIPHVRPATYLHSDVSIPVVEVTSA